jgi:hypothetical protein
LGLQNFTLNQGHAVRSAAVPAAAVRASGLYLRKQDALATAGKMPALQVMSAVLAEIPFWHKDDHQEKTLTSRPHLQVPFLLTAGIF